MQAARFIPLPVILLALASPATADEDLVAKREACRQEARQNVAASGRTGVEAYQRVVERRTAYVSTCMSRPMARGQEPPLPPRRRHAEQAAASPAQGPPGT